MSAFHNVASLMLAVITLNLLTACSSGPSEADIKAAIQQQYDVVNGLGSMFGVKKNIVEFKSVEKVGCDKIRENVFSCDIVVNATNAISGADKATANITLMKTKEGWRSID